MALNFDLILEDKYVLLRPVEEKDVFRLLELASPRELWNYFTYDLSDSDEFKKWLQPAIEKQRLQLVLIDKLSGEIVGSSAFGNYSVRDKRIEIGWTWLGKEYQGQGYNQKMKKLMLEYCFEVLGLERVEFKVDVLNTSARKGLNNVNAIQEGVLRSHTLMTKGRRRDTIFYSILQGEWRFVKRENDW
jgi:RimJ/RimL family protein N-acetyltransferase